MINRPVWHATTSRTHSILMVDLIRTVGVYCAFCIMHSHRHEVMKYAGEGTAWSLRRLWHSCDKCWNHAKSTRGRPGAPQVKAWDWKPSTQGRNTSDLSHCLGGSWSGLRDRPSPGVMQV